MSRLPEKNLNRILHEKVIEDFRRLFYQITGMPTSFFIHGKTEKGFDFYPPGKKCEYCRVIQSSPKALELCTRNDRILNERAKKLGKPLISQCFAGNTGVVVPVILDGRHLCTLTAGMVVSALPSSERFKKIKKRLNNLGIDFKRLQEVYFKMKAVSPKTMTVATELLSFMVNYIVNRENTILLHQELNQKQQEIIEYVNSRDHLKGRLERKRAEVKNLREELIKKENAGFMPATCPDETRYEKIIREAKNFIDQYFMEETGLSDAAKHVGLSPNYLSCLFKKECGYTFIEYLTRKRVERACQLLQDFRTTVGRVGMQVGYWDMNYFTQVFKKVTGTTPGKYRAGATARFHR